MPPLRGILPSCRGKELAMSSGIETNAAFHQGRESLNAAGALHSLEEWFVNLAPVRGGAKVLDLGCGTGKLALPYASVVGKSGSVTGTDLAVDSVNKLNARARETGAAHVSAIVLDHADAVSHFANERFDLIVSSYAIYYASDTPGLIASLHSLLEPGGRVFVCGPGEGTNREILELSVKAGATDNEAPFPKGFLVPTDIERAAKPYARSSVHVLPNSVRFVSANELLTWWRSHAIYVPSVDAKVEALVHAHFETNPSFNLTKNVLGVMFDA